MKKRIITISRQFGSGGHSIAQKVAERLGVAFYDNQLITEVAKQSGLSEDFIRENEEYASHSSSFLYQLAMSTAGTYGYPSVGTVVSGVGIAVPGMTGVYGGIGTAAAP